MKRFLQPHWIFWLITVPQLILLTLYFFSYQIIGSLLSPENLQYWYIYGGSLLTITAFSTLYGIVQHKRNQLVAWWFGLFLLIAYIPYLYFFGWNSNDIIPRNIPRWMLFSGDLLLYVFTFLTPALTYGIMLIVLWITPDNKAVRPWTDFLMAVMVPAIWYFLLNTMHFISKHGFSTQILDYLVIVLFISGTVVFFIFLIRGIYIVFLKKTNIKPVTRLFFKTMIAIVFPILGLLLNNGGFDGIGGAHFPEFIFGDFSHPLFYILAVVNGLLLCLPNPKNLRNHLVLFTARSITFSYIIYFFLVFLPYLPLAIPAIIIFGAGFLMLSPLLVFIVQAQILTHDLQYFRKYFNGKWLTALFAIALLSLPILVVTSYYQDRQELHKALDYVYAPKLQEIEKTNIDSKSIAKTLAHIRKNKENNRVRWTNYHQPYLTNFYQWLVLDNQTLSFQKLNLLEGVFTGDEVAVASSYDAYNLAERNNLVTIDSLYTTSTYHTEEDYWTSWIHFDIHNGTHRQDEFRMTFELPTGAWISDYYLVVEDEKKYGILAEKKAAMWVYQQIVNTRRDPGILYYLKGNEVAFRVFPLNSKETRYTGFELIHKEPLSLDIEGKELLLGRPKMQKALESKVSVFDEQITYLSTTAKEDLPKISRHPEYHFILDCSVASKDHIEEYSDVIHQFLTQKRISFSDVKILATDHKIQRFDYEPQWEEKLQKFNIEGGFFVERAIQSVLLEHYQNPSDTYPVFVVVTPTLTNAIFTGKLADSQFMLPDFDHFLHLKIERKPTLRWHKLWKDSFKKVADFSSNQIEDITVLAYPNAEQPIAYLPDNKKSSIVIGGNLEAVLESKELERKNWNNALALHALQKNYHLHAGDSDEKWLSLVKQSFETHIMSPFTSFMVVENEAQEAALMEKQRQVLNSKATLDTVEGESTPKMSEPAWWWMLLFIGVVIVIRRLMAYKFRISN